jgi:hypothetical protein
MNMELSEALVTCPNCERRFPLSTALRESIETQIEQRIELQYAERREFDEKEIQQRLADTAATAAGKAREDLSMELESMRVAASDYRLTITNLQASELAQRKRARDLEEREKSVALEVERQVDEQLVLVEEAAGKRVAEQYRLKDAEKDKQISDVRRQLEEAHRKAEQVSQQLQGEVAELDLEEQLRRAFPQDQFESVSTGQRGADVLQRVVDSRGQVCGTIIWERKNAKNFSDTWIPKLREDQRESHADVAVLVTAKLPKDVHSFGPKGRVWIASPMVVVALAHALRSGLLEIARARIVAEGVTGKQTALTEYINGTEFRQRIEAMLDPILALIEDLERECRATELTWARRRKRQEQIIRSIGGLWGDISGIMGTLPAPASLKLPAAADSSEAAA